MWAAVRQEQRNASLQKRPGAWNSVISTLNSSFISHLPDILGGESHCHICNWCHCPVRHQSVIFGLDPASAGSNYSKGPTLNLLPKLIPLLFQVTTLIYCNWPQNLIPIITAELGTKYGFKKISWTAWLEMSKKARLGERRLWLVSDSRPVCEKEPVFPIHAPQNIQPSVLHTVGAQKRKWPFSLKGREAKEGCLETECTNCGETPLPL